MLVFKYPFHAARVFKAPRMSATQTWDAGLAASRIRELQHLPGALLPILHALQEEFGYVDRRPFPSSPTR